MIVIYAVVCIIPKTNNSNNANNLFTYDTISPVDMD